MTYCVTAPSGKVVPFVMQVHSPVVCRKICAILFLFIEYDAIINNYINKFAKGTERQHGVSRMSRALTDGYCMN